MATPGKKGNSAILQKRNWYEDRFQSVVVQRNILFLITLVALLGVVFAVLTVYQVSSSKKVLPFVVQVDEKSGITTVVRPIDKFSTNESIQKYFIMKYLNARETYQFYDHRHQYYKVVPLLSEATVYREFTRWLRSDDKDAPTRFGAQLTRTIAVKSIVYLSTTKDEKGNTVYTVQIRFKRIDTTPRTRNESHKIATMNFGFYPLKLTVEQQAVNPLGFQVNSYRVDNEVENGRSR